MKKNKYIRGHYFRPRKDMHVSVRLDSRIYNYVMKYAGSNFSDRLENLILDHADRTDHIPDVLH